MTELVSKSERKRARGGSKPGERRGGRGKGTPNKATAKCREVIALVADGLASEFEGWLLKTAEGDPATGVKPDPKGAADLYLKAIEYHIPKLARTELSGRIGVMDATNLSDEDLERIAKGG